MIKNPGSPPSTGGTPGTVTSVSVATANGLAGTVANPTTTPAITVSTTVTGVVKGNGTALSAAAAADILAPFPSSLIPAANISGLAASATTDTTNASNITSGTLADGQLSINIPLKNGANIFTANQEISDAEPRFLLNEADQGADAKLWDFDVQSGVLTGRTRTDADAAGSNWIAVTRNATTGISNIQIGNATDNNPLNLLGTGGLSTPGGIVCGTSAGSLTASRVQVSASSVATTGIYLPATNTLGFSTNSTARGNFNASGTFTLLGGQVEFVRNITAAGAVTVAVTDSHVAIAKTVGAATTVNLPSTPATGTRFTIDDCKGDAATNNITITPAAGNIDGSGTYVINTNFGSWSGYYNGTLWKTTSSR